MRALWLEIWRRAIYDEPDRHKKIWRDQSPKPYI